MNPRDIIKYLCKEYCVSQKEIAAEMGLDTGNLSRSINHRRGKDMKLSTFVKIIECIGAQVTIETEDDDIMVDIDC